MAEQYTPTTEPWTVERIREAFIDDGGQSEYYDPIYGGQTQRRVAGGIFDSWLAAHDAQVLRDAALSGDYGTTAQSALLARANRIAGGTSHDRT